MFKKFGLQAVMVLIGVGVFAAVSAQVSTVGTISGTVRDPKGAAVPKAEVVIQQEGTGVSRTVNRRRQRVLSGCQYARWALHH